MRPQLLCQEKTKGPCWEYEGRGYRSKLTLSGPLGIFFLHLEHVGGKTGAALPRQVLFGRSNKGIEEAKGRYPKAGSQGIIKSALQVNENNEIVKRFALKCYYKRETLVPTPMAVYDAALAEAEAWDIFGEEAQVFIRSNKLTTDLDIKVYMLMPWIEGSDLFEVFSNKQQAALYTAQMRFQIIEKVYAALLQIGKAGKVFPDFKPENIMYDPAENKITLIDAMLIEGGKMPTTVTYAYLEKAKQIEGQRFSYDWQDQLYAFGLVARNILNVAPHVTEQDMNVGRALAVIMHTVFCAADRGKRPCDVDLRALITPFCETINHRSAPWFFKVRRPRIDIEEPVAATALQNGPT